MEMRKVHQVEKIKTKVLVKKYKKKRYNKRSILRHMVKDISDTGIDKRVLNSRPKVEKNIIPPKKLRKKIYNKIPLILSASLRVLHQ